MPACSLRFGEGVKGLAVIGRKWIFEFSSMLGEPFARVGGLLDDWVFGEELFDDELLVELLVFRTA